MPNRQTAQCKQNIGQKKYSQIRY
uniref:Uncharacterized protein n=1 Tax=Anguilla anguilla TaxID=7936 RepID=A0A0E9PNR6_ANGAN